MISRYKKELIAGIIFFIFIVWGLIYFIGGISSFYPPIKKYEYNGSINELMINVDNYVKDMPNTGLVVTDTVGLADKNFAIYLTLKGNKSESELEYFLKVLPDYTSASSLITKIDLISAYNLTNKTGGFSDDDNGVDTLIKYFDADILPHLLKHNKLKPN